MRIYATETNIKQWIEEPPKNIRALLRHASLMVEQATRLDVYTVDEDGYPTDTDIEDAFRDAVCSQIAMWTTSGLDPTKGYTGQKAQIASQSVPGGSVSYAGALTVEQLGVAANTLCDAAIMRLKQVGLCRQAVKYLG
ncbi:hypothetical protein AY551_01335 [Corynebacterium diphtheriae bv. gravis]|uniref:hypothetical protein n=1 Tax=Corynebacterium diphtheriae TaxID=1717 RepID=UPI000B4B1897|nr:hypothetical protein [Corynebacterium diphtheriae]OWN69283.1 hypothetical protein AY518_03030 [Corynebacterium diphtheriae bv. gravis]OWO50075.1 hypothetical protein AY551_01335 [Corynebacterium diphtheriae bv. gravis]CAB1035808.1 hypothetical protein NCTC10648_01009 [Corynebacterium diphtheriae]